MSKNTNCQEYIDLIGAYLDKELSSEDTDRVRKHIEKCDDCSKELELLRELDVAAKADVIEDPGTEFWRDQRENIRAEIEGRSKTANVKPLVQEAAHTGSRSKIIKWSKIVSVAAAAVIVFVLFKELDRFKTPVQPETGQTQMAAQTEAEQKPVEEETTPVKIDVPEREETQEVLAARTEEVSNPQEQTRLEPQTTTPTVDNEQTKISLREAQPIRRPSVMISGATQANIFDPIAAKFEKYEEAEELSRVTRQRRINSYDENIFYNTVGLQAGDVRYVLPTERKKPKNTEEEYQGYLDNKLFIKELEDPIAKKNCWLKYLTVVEENMVFELILEDVYNLYEQVTTENSPGSLKKEAFDFMTGFKDFLIRSHGENIVEDKIDFYRQIQ
ncbi:MAG: hypothetical protein GY863_00030 [bacterium]|nr:hypothetical protein [bacterium]